MRKKFPIHSTSKYLAKVPQNHVMLKEMNQKETKPRMRL